MMSARTRPPAGRPPARAPHRRQWATWLELTHVAGKPRDPHPVDPRRSKRPDNPDDYRKGRRDGDQARPKKTMAAAGDPTEPIDQDPSPWAPRHDTGETRLPWQVTFAAAMILLALMVIWSRAGGA